MQCTATQTGHHWGTGVHRLPEHTPHVHSHRGGCWCSQLWTQCAGCQSSACGGEILTAGEKGDNDRSIAISEVIVSTTDALIVRLSETKTCYNKPPYLITCSYLCQFSAVLVKRW